MEPGGSLRAIAGSRRHSVIAIAMIGPGCRHEAGGKKRIVHPSPSPEARPRSYRANLEALVAAQKPPRGTAAYSRLVNRPLGRRVAAATSLIGMTPNVATAISSVMSGSALAMLVLLEPSWLVGLGIAVLLAGGYVMDSVDGQLARLASGGSLRGEWLDHTVDTFKNSFLHLAVLISWYRFAPIDNPAILLVPIGYEVIQMVEYFSQMLMPSLRARGGAVAPPSDAREHPLRKWVLLPNDYGVLCWLFVLMAWPMVFAVAYTGFFVINALFLSLALAKWWRELGRLDAIAEH